MEQRFAPALSGLHKVLETASLELRTPIRFALIGGLAVATWGVVRATQDIDFLADSDPTTVGDVKFRERLKNFIQRQYGDADWHVGEHDDPIPLLLRIELPPAYGGLGTDILWAHKRWQREALQRRVTVDVLRRRVYVLHPEDLILMKLDAGGPQDLLDVQQLLSAHLPRLSIRRLKENAARVRLGKTLEKCLREARGRD